MSKLNWQQPYVNTFKHFTIASDKNVAKHGDITNIMDNQIKTTVYKISGSNTNFINMPKLSGQSLGLTGRYIYFLFKPIPNKCFSIHVDLTTIEKVVVRISFSNLFKEFKATSSWLQFPYVIQAPKGTVYEKTEMAARDLSGSAPPVTKWTILCIDLISICQSYTNRTYESVRGFKLCANMLVKNVITSDMLYEPGVNYAEARLRNGSAFPRELAYPCEKYENWHQLYDYLSFPSESFRRPFDSVGQSRILTTLNDFQSYNSSSNNTEPKRVQVKQVYTQSTAYAVPHTAIDSLTQKSSFLKSKSVTTKLPLVGVENDDNTNFVSPDDFEKQNERDIHVYPFKSGHDLISSLSSSASSLSINEKNNNLSADEIEVDFDVKHENQNNDYQTKLEPDPILRLNKIIGFGSRAISTSNILNSNLNTNNYTNCVKWSTDSQYLIYACQAIVVAYHLNANNQYCFVGHSDRVSCISLSPDNSIIASGQAGPYSLVRLWDFQTRKCLSIFRNHDHSLYLLEYSSCGNYLCGVGKDKQGKSMVVLWEVKNIRKNMNTNKINDNFVKVVAKAHTDVHINRIIFFHYDSTRLVTCGRENVRFWRLKNDTLRSCAANLTPYIQSLNINSSNESEDEIEFKNKSEKVISKIYLEFTDICMNSRLNHNDNLLYACTNLGQIFIFNMAKMEIENVRILEPIIKKTGILSKNHTISNALKLNTLTVSDSFCVTGSDDGYVRIWPLDFSQLSVEAEHESAIGVVRFSTDCSKIATATLSGNLGILDVAKKEYMTLVRSHTDSILDISIDQTCKYIATCSTDSTVRVWCLDNYKQLYDFSAPNERPTRLCFNPINLIGDNQSNHKTIFACGFNSGKIRIFNVAEAKLLTEIKSPHVKGSEFITNSNANNTNSIISKYEITDLKYSNDGKRLISGDCMKYLCLYDSERDYSLLRILPNSISSFGSLNISPDNKHMAVIGPSDSLISVLDSLNLNEVLRINILINSISNEFTNELQNDQFLNSQTCNSLLSTKTDSAVRLCYAPYELNHLICVTSSNKLLKFDSKNGRLLSSIPRIHRSLTDCLNVSNDGRFLITSGDNCVKIWDYEMRLDRNFQTFIGHSSPVNRILLTPDNKTLITVGDTIVFWDFLAYFPIDDKNNSNKIEMPQGRELNTLKYNVIRESTSKNKDKKKKEKSFLNPNIDDYNEITILHEQSFSEMTKKTNFELENNKQKNSNSICMNYSFERPRTPPVATDIYIETITSSNEIDVTFLNDDLSVNNETITNDSDISLNKKSIRNFTNLPNFVNENDKLAANSESNPSTNFISGKVIESIYNESPFNKKKKVPESDREQKYANDFIDYMKPNNYKHLNFRKKESICARKKYAAPEDKCGIRLSSVIGYNGKNASENMIWNPEREFFASSIGSIISVEDLKTGKQKNLYSHHEDITTLALKNDFTQMASVSSYLLNIPIPANKSNESIDSSTPKCQIIIWDCINFEKIANIFHKNASNITCMSFSTDDRFLISISDYMCPSLVIWSSFDYSSFIFIESLNYIINDVSWNPLKCNELVMGGTNKSLIICYIEEKSYRNGSLNFNELEIPIAISEQQNDKFDFTSIAYGDNNLLFAATSQGLVTVWNTKTNSCFLNWKADINEIDVLVSVKHKLITGSSKGNLKLWNISSINNIKSSDKKERNESRLIIENEINLNGAIKCSKFDPTLDIGILGTSNGTLWYVNWQEESSVRLVSTHSAKINSICCIDDKYLSTVSDDGSLNIWSLSDRERIVQFELKVAATCQTLIHCDNKLFNIITKYPKSSGSKSSLIVVGYNDGSVRLYDIDKKNIINKIKPINHCLTAIHFCENTYTVLVGSIEGIIVVIDLNQGVATRIINDHKGAPITSLDSFYKEDKKLTYWLACSRDRRVSVWNSKWSEDLIQMLDWLSFPAPSFNSTDKIEDNKDKQLFSYHNWLKYPPSLAYFEPVKKAKQNQTTDTIIYVGYGLQKQVIFYNFIKKQIIRNMDLTEWPECMAISPKLNLIAFGTKSRLLQIKDYNQSTFQDFSQHSDTVSCVCFSNDGKKLFSTSFNEIFIWDVTI